MKLYIDSADAREIRRLCAILNVAGVTTNPSIIVSQHKPFEQIIKEIDSVLSEDQILFVQVMAEQCDKMVEEARYINTLRKNMGVKIPVTAEGYKAIKKLHEEGIRILATAIHSASQGILAAANGADYLAPYVNRISNFSDGVQETLTLQKMLEVQGYETEIIAASFKNTSQVKQLLAGGVESVTLPVDVADMLYENPYTDVAVEKFKKQWQQQYDRDGLIK